MTAAALVTHHGAALVGRHVMTEAVGEYPGGIARVTRLADTIERESDIVYFVEWKDHPPADEIGVFEWEQAQLIHRALVVEIESGVPA